MFFNNNLVFGSLYGNIIYKNMQFCLPLGIGGLSASQTDILPGTRLLWQVHAHPREHGKGTASAHRHHSSLHSLQNRGKDHAGEYVKVLIVSRRRIRSKPCLFFQEIYPPKLTELAYVTDGACLEEEILQMELIMLKVCVLSFLVLFNNTVFLWKRVSW